MTSIITKHNIEKTIVIKNGKEMVRSDKLALMFEKQHKHILEIIKKKSSLFQVESSTLKFSEYFIEDKALTSKGKEYTRYFLTRKGFDFIALSLVGERADLYKLWYIDAFHDKQRVIEEHKLTAKLNKKDDLWLQFREEGKVFRNKLTQVIHDTIVTYRELNENKMNDGKYYYHYTSLIYSILKIDLPKGENLRDVLDKRMLVRLEDMEDKVADMILKFSQQGIYYKDVYKKIKEIL